MRFLSSAALLLLAMLLSGAADSGRSEDRPPVLAELFTSQACSSCPPAEALFADLADEDGVVALEWHVTYWDELSTSEGVWADPYADQDFTERQRAYNQNLRGTRSVYTPQAVIGGKAETVGSRGQIVRRLVDDADRGVRLSIERIGDGLEVTVPDSSGAALWVALFDHEATTQVTRGENAGKGLRSRNIVRRAARLTPDPDGRVALPAPGPGQGCAAWLQEPDLGKVLAAAYCPE